MAVIGRERAIAWSPCHFGRKPRRGGSLARESSMVARANLVGAAKVVMEVIFCDVRFMDRNDSIIIVVVVM